MTDDHTDGAQEYLDLIWNEYVSMLLALRDLKAVAPDEQERDTHARAVELIQDRANECESALLTIPPEPDGKHWCQVAAVQLAIRINLGVTGLREEYAALAQMCDRDYLAEMPGQD